MFATVLLYVGLVMFSVAALGVVAAFGHDIYQWRQRRRGG